MGGCRCSYRNCSLRTDGKTHMFHYPVFDKVRCHQWLTNAHKLEFLNLKVSQLKNRVVCQHHFIDEYFMNFKKNKLTFDAVPTEDGPYCASDQLEEKQTEQYDTKTFGISLDDIENEYLTIIDKKANFSVKYGDFLTNCEIMELDSLNQMVSDNSQIEKKCLYEQSKSNEVFKDFQSGSDKNVSCITNNTVEPHNIILNDNINRNTPKIKVDPIVYNFDSSKNNLTQTEDKLNLLNPNNYVTVPIEIEATSENNQNVNRDQSMVNHRPNQQQTKEKSLLKKNIKIISEKRISEPVTFVGKLERLSPSTVLPLPKRKKEIVNSKVQDYPEPSANLTEATFNSTDQLTNSLNQDKINSLPQNTTNLIKNNIKDKELPKTSLLKTKMPPERVAAIAEKRKFNMKLRDIVEDCLDKLDEPNYEKRTVTYAPKKRCKEQEVRTYLSKEKDLPSIQEYTIAYLEARMKKMENNLLNKIDQNSQKIVDLKETFASSSFKKKNAHTQTTLNEDQHKKQLYHEISKYLSQEANSLIYEQLFIDKYSTQFSKRSSSAKRSKYD